MRRTMLTLCALALVAPLSAQEPVAAPKQVAPANTPMYVPATPERQGLLSRLFNRNRDSVPMNGNVTQAPMPAGTTMVMEPMYDRRGNITGYRQVYTNPAPMTAMTPTPAPAATPAPTITQAGATVNMEPMYDRRGRITGWRPVQPAPAVTPGGKSTEMPKPTETPSTPSTAGKTAPAPVTQTGYVEPMPEQPRRGLLSRIFRR